MTLVKDGAETVNRLRHVPPRGDRATQVKDEMQRFMEQVAPLFKVEAIAR